MREREKRHWEALSEDKEGRRILQEERVFGKGGEYRLQFWEESRVVRRQNDVRLRREGDR